MSLIELTAVELLEQLHSGQTTSADVTRAFLDQIDAHDAAVHAFLRVDRSAAMARAEDIDARRRAGKPLGRLAGLPVAVKDVLCTEGEPTTCGSRMLENFRPPYDATVIARLKTADAVLIGRTNMDEFAMGGSNENSAFFPDATTRGISHENPGWQQRRLGGVRWPLGWPRWPSAAIRAVRSAAPAGLCGISGLKPTYGRVSRRRARGVRQQLGPDRPARDRRPRIAAVASWKCWPATIRRIRHRSTVPVPEVYRDDRANRLRRVADWAWCASISAKGWTGRSRRRFARRFAYIESLGAATVKELSLPHGKYAVATYYIIAPCEASSNLGPIRRRSLRASHGRFQGFGRPSWKPSASSFAARGRQGRTGGPADNALVSMYRRSRARKGFGAEVKRRIMIGTYALSAGYYDAYYKKALQVRRLIRQDFDRAFEDGRLDRWGRLHADAGVQDRRARRRSVGHVSVRPVYGEHESGRALPAFRLPLRA